MGMQVKLVVPGGRRFPEIQAELVVPDEFRVLVALDVARKIECRENKAEITTSGYAQRRQAKN